MAQDHFSTQAATYAKFRPHYPKALYEFVLQHVPHRHCAWDCATGNGQVARVLAEHFQRVEATDISKKQLEFAIKAPNINYQIAFAEQTNFPNHCFDLITVAQALHWFSFDSFYKEVKRILMPNGRFVVWHYQLLQIHPEIDKVIRAFYEDVIGPYWPAERKHIDSAYGHIPFPFQQVIEKEFESTFEWELSHLLGYLYSWSSTQAYKKEKGNDPILLIQDKLEKLWPQGEKLKVNFPIHLKICSQAF